MPKFGQEIAECRHYFALQIKTLMRQESTIYNVTNKWLAFFILKPNLNQLTEAGGDQSHERLRAAAYGPAI